MKNFPNYPDMLKFFYRYNFPADLGAPATSVALAIIHKSNELIWPPSFKMSNMELSNLSGEKLSNIGRSRQKVLERCKVDGVPVFTYTDGEQRRCGTYKINFHITSTQLQDNFNETSTQLQNTPVIDNDHNETNPNLIKKGFEKKSVVPTSQEQAEKARLRELLKKPVWDSELLHEAHKFGAEIRKEHDWVNANIESVRLDLIKLLDYDIEDVLAVMKEKNTPGWNTDDLEWVVNELEGGK